MAALPIALDPSERPTRLELHHRDPFNRPPIAQSLVEDIPLISRDAQCDACGVKRIITTPRAWDT